MSLGLGNRKLRPDYFFRTGTRENEAVWQRQAVTILAVWIGKMVASSHC